MKKRTYGTGSFRKLPSGKYQIRYKGETDVIKAASDKARHRGAPCHIGEAGPTAIKKSHIHEYIDKRVEAGASNGTINRELSATRRSLNLGLEEELVPRVPVIKPLKESDPRQDFVEEDLYRTMLRELPPHARACGPLATSRGCGWARSAV